MSDDQTQFYFYVLHCKDGSFYAGYTTDLHRRLEEHNTGNGAKYTRLKHRRPLQMIHAESFPSKSAAMKAEYAFKQLNRKQKEIYLKNHQEENLLTIKHYEIKKPIDS